MTSKRNKNMFSREEEMALILRAKGGDVKALNDLVVGFNPLIEIHARKFAGGRGHDTLQDAIQDARMGFLKAISKFDPSLGFRLSTYSRDWMRIYIEQGRDGMAASITTPFDTLSAGIRVNVAKIAQKIQLKEGVSRQEAHVRAIKEEARMRSVPESRIHLAIDRGINSRVVSASTPIGGTDGEVAIIDTIVDSSPDPESSLAIAQTERFRTDVLERIMAVLSERHAEVIRRRFLIDPPDTLEALANDFGVSRERIRQMEEKGLEKMRFAMREVAPSPEMLRNVMDTAGLGDTTPSMESKNARNRRRRGAETDAEHPAESEICDI